MLEAMSASIQPRSGGRHQLRVTHKLLPKAFFHTFEGADSYAAAASYRDQLLAMLAQGTVPQALVASSPRASQDHLVHEIISSYEKNATIAASDLPILKLLREETAGLRASDLTYEWVEAWARRLKLQDNLAPGTIRKRVESLGRVYHWHLTRVTSKGQALPANPMRLLPRGYSQYSVSEAQALGEGKAVKVDEQRDRRLSADEEARIRLALAGTKRVDRERSLTPDPEFTLLFDLILDSGLRLREAYRLMVAQIDFARGVLRLEGSKAKRGQRKPRVVPLKKHLRSRLADWCKGRSGRVFPQLWDGDDDPQALERTTHRLGARFASLFAYAEVLDFTEHDLRHEATCRWFELRNPKGAWLFSEIEICKIMGWTTTKMALRYASLRGEDLADRLL